MTTPTITTFSWVPEFARGFVRDLGHNTDDLAIVRSIIGLADSFGLRTVAEGVETAAQAEKLVGLGVHYLQGYLFSDILLPDAAREWLRDRNPAIHFKTAAGAIGS